MSAPAPPSSARPVNQPVYIPSATEDKAPAKKSLMIPIMFGVAAIGCALGLFVLKAEPAPVEAVEASSFFACPDGSVTTGQTMRVTAGKLNVRAGPSTRDARLSDRTLRKQATVTEECRAGSWSRIRLVDGRAGWVANEFLTAPSQGT